MLRIFDRSRLVLLENLSEDTCFSGLPPVQWIGFAHTDQITALPVEGDMFEFVVPVPLGVQSERVVAFHTVIAFQVVVGCVVDVLVS